jgi:hypothetical protein
VNVIAFLKESDERVTVKIDSVGRVKKCRTATGVAVLMFAPSP